MNLSVIRNDKPKASKYDLFYRAYERVLNRYKENPDQDRETAIKKLVFYGAKAVNGKVLETEPTEWRFEFADIVKDLMSTLTPREFENIFPITKEYDGTRWGTKDYFYTKEYVTGLNQNEPIGGKILDFLWEYHNKDIHIFTVRLMCLMSDMRKLQGYPGIAEEWAAENRISMFTMHTDPAGKKFMIDSHGKTTRVKPVIPKYLRLVK